MRRSGVLLPELGTLGYTETVLFVNDGHTEAGKGDGIFQHGMSADEDMYLPRNHSVENLCAPFAFDAAREQLHPYVHPTQHTGDGFVVLASQYLGGGHHAGLITVVQGDEHGHQCHQRLATAHIALKQAVHLTAASHIPAYFLDDTLLRTRQFKRKVLGVKGIEHFAHLAEYKPPIALLALLHVSQDIELHEEEFFKLQAELRLSQVFGSLGEMDVHQCLGEGDKVILLDDVIRKGFGQRLFDEVAQIGHQLLYRAGVEPIVLHLFRCIVVGLQPHVGEHQFIGRVNVGVGNVHPSAKDGGLAEDNVRSAHLVLSRHKLLSLKPHQIHHSCAIAEMGDETFAVSFAGLFVTEYLSAQLDVGHVAVNLMHIVEPATVDIFIREIVQQVMQRADTELLLQHSRPLGAYTRKILDITGCKVEHDFNVLMWLIC